MSGRVGAGVAGWAATEECQLWDMQPQGICLPCLHLTSQSTCADGSHQFPFYCLGGEGCSYP